LKLLIERFLRPQDSYCQAWNRSRPNLISVLGTQANIVAVGSLDRSVLPNNGSCDEVRYCDYIIGRGKDFFDSVRERAWSPNGAARSMQAC
jgi:hypothetical protein